jgi:MFS transporter, PPP family, 3-phenylpropionic acid transporter
MAAFFGIAFFVNGILMPFFPVLLSSKGLSGGQIAFVLATPQILRVALMPVVSGLSDRARDRRLVMGGLVALALLACIMLGLVSDSLLIVATGALMLTLSYCVGPLCDTVAILLDRSGQGDYGRMRLWGSATFVAGNLIGGFALDRAGVGAIYVLIVLSFAVTLVATPLTPAPKPQGSEPALASAAVLWRPAFLLVVFGHAVNQASHAALYGFGTLAWQARGYDDVTIGGFWAVGVVAEIALFAYAARLPRHVRPTTLMMFGAVVATARWSLSSIDLGSLATAVLQLSHAASFAISHFGLTRFIRAVVPSQRVASAQGVYVVFNGLTMALSTGLAGHFWPKLGDSCYLVMIAFSLTGFLALAIGRRLIADLRPED